MPELCGGPGSGSRESNGLGLLLVQEGHTGSPVLSVDSTEAHTSTLAEAHPPEPRGQGLGGGGVASPSGQDEWYSHQVPVPLSSPKGRHRRPMGLDCVPALCYLNV